MILLRLKEGAAAIDKKLKQPRLADQHPEFKV